MSLVGREKPRYNPTLTFLLLVHFSYLSFFPFVIPLVTPNKKVCFYDTVGVGVSPNDKFHYNEKVHDEDILAMHAYSSPDATHQGPLTRNRA